MTERAPMRLLKLFGVTGSLSTLLWQVECKVRKQLEDPEVGRGGDLLHIPPHIKVLVNCAFLEFEEPAQ